MSGNTKSKQMSMVMRQQIANVRSKAADGTGAILIGRKVKAQPIRSEDERLEMLKGGVDDELGQLHKTNALLIAAQFAANHECEFDVSDALAAIIARVERHIETLDGLCLRAPAHDGHDSGVMADSIPVAWRTVFRGHTGQCGPLSGMVSGMPGTLST